MFWLLFVIGVTGQETQKSSLLWRIEGADLDKPSYLYGTMHVSERIAFHLTDSFFEALSSTDLVALESNPETWLEERVNSEASLEGFTRAFQPNFYDSFLYRESVKRDVVNSLRLNTYLVNGILSRTNDSKRDFQEQTYLDMFLYQAGRRTGRNVLALEDNQEARELVRKAQLDGRENDPPEWGKRLIKDMGYRQALENAYRAANLDRIDSLNLAFNTPIYLENMLYKRNRNMVEKMDSVLQAGRTMFAGVGAAHLPGQKGMVVMLKELGYKVIPVIGMFNAEARKEKESLDTMFVKKNYGESFTRDSLISLNTPNKLYSKSSNGGQYSLSLDIANGAQVHLFRMNWNSLKKNVNLEEKQVMVDSLFFENIPGKILSKSKIEVSGYPGFHIKNRKKNGDMESHVILITPIELIHASLLGQKEFVLSKPNWWKSVKIHNNRSDWRTYKPLSEHFEIALPPYAKVMNDNDLTHLYFPKEVVAYAPKIKAKYFLVERHILEPVILEDTSFEHKILHDKFYTDLKLDSVKTYFKEGSYYSQAKGNKPWRLKSVIDGSRYYLMGTNDSSNRFFDSFKSFKSARKQKDWKTWDNEPMLLKVKTPYRKKTDEPLKIEGYSEEIKRNQNYFSEKGRTDYVYLPGGRYVQLRSTRMHAYDYFETPDSLWTEILRRNGEDLSYKILSEKKLKTSNINQWVAEYGDTLSEQKIKAKYVLKNGHLFSLKSLVDVNYEGEDVNLEYVFNNFEPHDSIVGPVLWEAKNNRFFNDVYASHDSVRYSALNSMYRVDFDEKDVPKLKKLAKNLSQEEGDKIFLSDLYNELAMFPADSLLPFYTEQYTIHKRRAELQIDILNGMAQLEDSAAMETIVNVMRADLPLTTANSSVLVRFFDLLKEQNKYSSSLINGFMEFVGIPEYQYYVLDWLAHGLVTQKIPIHELNPYEQKLLFNARLQLKRAQAKVLSYNDDKKKPYLYRFSALESYLQVLRHLPNSKEKINWLEGVYDLNVPSIQKEMARLMLMDDKALRMNTIEKIARIPKYLVALYDSAYANEKTTLLPKQMDLTYLSKNILKKYDGLGNSDEVEDLKFYSQEIQNKNGEKWVIRTYKVDWNQDSYRKDKNTLYGLGFRLDPHGYIIPDSVTYTHLDYDFDEDLPSTVKKVRNAILFIDKARFKSNAIRSNLAYDR